MRPIAQSDGHDAPRLGFEFVPGVAAVIDESVGVEKDTVGQPVVPHELPDVLLRVELGALWRQRHDGDVGRHHEFRREVPSGLVEQQGCMASWGDIGRDSREGQDQPDRLALLGADGAEDVG